MTHITVYFDLVSPYAWLALHAVDGIRQDVGRELIVIPVAFGAILKCHGQPAPVALPAKRAHLRRHPLAYRRAPATVHRPAGASVQPAARAAPVPGGGRSGAAR